MAGYQNYSKSNNAIEAEQNGLYPRTVLAARIGVSAQAIRAILTPCEWHHVSKFSRQQIITAKPKPRSAWASCALFSRKKRPKRFT